MRIISKQMFSGFKIHEVDIVSKFKQMIGAFCIPDICTNDSVKYIYICACTKTDQQHRMPVVW